MLGQMKQMMMRKHISIKSEIEKVPKHDVTIVMGDLSAKVGKDNSGNERVMRKYGYGNINDNGERFVCLFYVPLEFQPKMKNRIYHQSTGFLNYTSDLSNSAILLGLPNAPRNLFPNY
jgi:hypothetical protein